MSGRDSQRSGHPFGPPLAGHQPRRVGAPALLDQLTVGAMMTCFVMTTVPDCLMTEAVGRMLGHRVGALPVVEDRRVVSILTHTDVLCAFRSVCLTLSVTA